jgi:hypothetical protein
VTVYTMGDSHCYETFGGIDGVVPRHIGSVTMKRLGYMEDTLLPSSVASIGLTPRDVLLIICGEGDTRCFIHPQLVHRTIAMEDLLQQYADRYVERVRTLDVNGARAGIVSVPPPAAFERCWHIHSAPSDMNLPPQGTDAERVLYTMTLNRLIADGCSKSGLLFVDIFSRYSDENGMLITALSDGSVHIKDTSRAAALLGEMGLLP